MFLVTPIYRGLTSTNSLIKVLLSVPPTLSTVERAENYLESSRAPRTDPVSIRWKNILDEEPFEGQHWEGVYGLPPGSTVEGWETKSLDSTPPYSPLPLGDFGDLTPSLSLVDSLSELAAEDELSLSPDVNSASMANMSSFGHRQLIEDLQRRQYWRTDWQTDASLTPSFAIKNVSSLGVSFGHGESKQLVDVLCVGPLVDLILGEQNSLGPSVPPRVVSKFFSFPEPIASLYLIGATHRNTSTSTTLCVKS